MKSSCPLFCSVRRCCSLSVCRLHWTSMSSSSGSPTFAAAPLASSSLSILPLAPESLFGSFLVRAASRPWRLSKCLFHVCRKLPQLWRPPTRSAVCHERTPTSTSFLGDVKSPGLLLAVVLALLVLLCFSSSAVALSRVPTGEC